MSRSEDRRNALILAHLHLVAPIVGALRRRGLPPCWSDDDLTQMGRMGLICAASDWRASLRVPFGIWARVKIRGAILDAIKGREWRESTRDALGTIDRAAEDDPDGRMDDERLLARLSAAVHGLSSRQRRAIRLHLAGMTQVQVAKRMRISQQAAAALEARARAALRRAMAA